MIPRRLNLGGLSNIEIISVTLNGDPSAVHTALLKLYFDNGQVMDWEVSFDPDGIMYESLLETIKGVQREISRKLGELD